MAINNPYIPGDPFSYDLKWIIRQIKLHREILEGLDARIQAAIEAALSDLDLLGPKYFSAAADLISSDAKDGDLAYIEGFYVPGDTGANLYFVTTDYNDIISAKFYLTLDGPNRWAIPIIVTPYVTPEMFGAQGVADGNDADAIEKCFDYADSKSIVFRKKDYYTTRTVVVPTNANRVTIEGNFANIYSKHNGDGINFTSSNSELGRLSVKNLRLTGPNPNYGRISDFTSTGAGLHLVTAYHNVFENVQIVGYKYGLNINQGIGNRFSGDSYFRFNEYGVYLKGNATSFNTFHGCSIRENRICGAYISYDTGNPPQANVFDACLFENNKPYFVDEQDASVNSWAVYLKHTNNNVFTNCYFEAHLRTFVFDGLVTTTKIADSFTTSNGSTAILFDMRGSGNRFNKIDNLTQGSSTMDTAITSDTNDTLMDSNVFTNCNGLPYDFSRITGATKPLFVYARKNEGNYGINSPMVQISPAAQIYASPSVTNPYIDGIGTTNATLYTNGYAEVQLSSLSADTTITSVSGVSERGKFLIINNYQTAHSLTLKAGSRTGAAGTMVLANNQDIVLNTANACVVFYVSYTFQLVEIGRSI